MSLFRKLNKVYTGKTLRVLNLLGAMKPTKERIMNFLNANPRLLKDKLEEKGMLTTPQALPTFRNDYLHEEL